MGLMEQLDVLLFVEKPQLPATGLILYLYWIYTGFNFIQEHLLIINPNCELSFTVFPIKPIVIRQKYNNTTIS